MASEARRFQTAAAHYLAGRPSYPRMLIERVAGFCGLTRADRVLDLGCGPGPLALAFAPFVGAVVAVDPEPEMLRVAREAVAAAGAAVEVREGSSETLGPQWGHFRAVTMGRSFHWMDRAETLRRLDAVVEPGGAVVLFNDELTDTPDNAALRAWQVVVERYAADDAVRAERRTAVWQRHEVVLRASPFSRVDELIHMHQASISIEVLVHRALSMSGTTESRLGPRTGAMVEELRAVLQPFAAAGPLTEHIEWTATVARRP